MNAYVRATEMVKKPVVTLGGEDVGQVKDIVFDPERGALRCFTLSGRGLLASPLKRALLWDNVHALGPDAVMIRDDRALEDDDQAAKVTPASGGGNVLGSRVMTDDGTDLGKIVDAVVETGRKPQVVGYEVQPTRDGRRRVLLPVVKPTAVSEEIVVVPKATGQFTVDDFGGFSEAARGLRTRLEGES